MKKITIMLCLAAFAFKGFSQDNSYAQGNVLVNLGVGIGNLYWGSGYKTSLPVNPSASVEYGISDRISVGVGAAYSSVKLDVTGFDEIKYNGIAIQGRGSYHFLTSEKLDPYFGISLGYVNVSVKDDGNAFGSAKASGFGWGGHLGVRYYFSPAVDIYGKLVASIFSIINAGVAIKL